MKNIFPKRVLFDEVGLSADTISSLKLMILAVAFGVVWGNITTGVAMTGYLKEIGLSDFSFGLVYAVTPIFSTLQLFASYVLERTQKRKFILMLSGLAQRIAWLPFGLIPFFVPMSLGALRVWMVFLFVSVSAISAPFLNVSFFSLASDLVPMNIRGRYFATRSRISTICGVVGGILTAQLLDKYSSFAGYAFVFALASVTGSIDILCFSKMKFPPMQAAEKSESFLSMVVDVLRNKTYMKFVMFVTIWAFSVNLSQPFYFVHMKQRMLLSNTFVTVLMQILPNICTVFVVSSWGRALDKYGNKSIMHIANGILCIAPFLWVFTGANAVSIVLVAICGLMQGLLAVGFDLGVQNMFLGQSPNKNRSMFIAMYFVFTALIGAGAANAMGGFLLDNVFSVAEGLKLHLFGVTFTRYNYLFLLTAILRCVAILILLPKMTDEERYIPPREMIRRVVSRMKARRRYRAVRG